MSIKAILTPKGLLVAHKTLTEKQWAGVKTDLTLNHTTRIGRKIYTKTLVCYREIVVNNVPYMLMPRHYDFATKLCITDICYVDRRNPGIELGQSTFLDANYVSPVKLFDDQQLAMDHIFAADDDGRLKGHNGRILVMNTGLGKTFCGGAFIAQHCMKALVIVPGLSAAGEWLKMFANYPYLTCGQYNGKVKEDGDVVVITIDSALADKIGGVPAHDYFAKFGTIVFDEIHDLPTPSRMEIFWRTSAANTLGLTATPDERPDGMYRMLDWFLGPIVRLSDIAPEKDADKINWRGHVTVVKYSGSDEYTREILQKNTGWRDHGATVKMLAEDPIRNSYILQRLRQLYDAGNNTYIFTFNRAHAERLFELTKLPIDKGGLGLPEKECALLMGGADLAYKEWAMTNCRAIFVTDSYGKQSISAGHMDAIINGTPFASNIVQRLGRILRRNGNVDIVRQIIDIVDVRLELRKMFNARKKGYDLKSFTNHSEIVDYKKIIVLPAATLTA